MKKVTVLFMEEDAALAAAMSGQVDVAHTAASYSDQQIEGYELFRVDTVDNRGFNLPCVEPQEKDGIIYGNAAQIDGIMDRMEAELGEKASAVATGGLAKFITPLCRHHIVYDDALLLKGLLILYRKNTQHH